MSTAIRRPEGRFGLRLHHDDDGDTTIVGRCPASVCVCAIDSARVITSSPAKDPRSWLLAFIDVETTGLVPVGTR